MKPNKQRRIVLIDSRFQLRMAVEFIALQVLLTCLFASLLYLFMDSEIHADLASAHASYQSLSELLLPIVAVLTIFSVTLSILLATVFVVKISHRIAGPMHRFNTVLESLSQRRFETVTRIRPDDQLGELASTLGEALAVVKGDIHSLKSALEDLRASQAAGDSGAVEAELIRIENTLNAWGK